MTYSMSWPVMLPAVLAVGMILPAGPSAAADVRTSVVEAVGEAGPELSAAPARRHRSSAPRATSPQAALAKGFAARRADGAAGAPIWPQSLVAGRSFGGQYDAKAAESDATGAVGPTRYVQLVNSRFGIVDKGTNKVVGAGTLQSLVGASAATYIGGQQAIWDATTNRFYYSASGGTGFEDNILYWGFSKTASPSSAKDWCRYKITYDSSLSVDFPRLGDSQYFLILGANLFDTDDFLGSAVVVIPKPPTGTSCPAAAAFKATTSSDLRTGSGSAVSPVPVNEIDTLETGYVVAVDESLPSTQVWLFDVTRAKSGAPVIAAVGRRVAVASYTYPPDAEQGGAGQLIHTLDGRLTQAVLSRNPNRANAPSIWTQHTINAGGLSAIRWYEIKPTAPAAVLRSATYTVPGAYLYNGAISSDRRVDGATSQFGGSFVMTYNASSAANNSNPRIVAGSSLNGGAYKTVLVKDAVGPFIDKSLCPSPGYVCPWSAQAGASPDPRPAAGPSGIVWLTNQYVGSAATTPATPTWRSWIFAFTP